MTFDALLRYLQECHEDKNKTYTQAARYVYGRAARMLKNSMEKDPFMHRMHKAEALVRLYEPALQNVAAQCPSVATHLAEKALNSGKECREWYGEEVLDLVSVVDLKVGECFRKEKGEVVYKLAYVYDKSNGSRMNVGFRKNGSTTTLDAGRIYVRMPEEEWS